MVLFLTKSEFLVTEYEMATISGVSVWKFILSELVA